MSLLYLVAIDGKIKFSREAMAFLFQSIMQKADVYHDAFPHIILFPISHFITTNISLQAHSRSRQETQQSTHCSKASFFVQKLKLKNKLFWHENSNIRYFTD